MRAVDLSVARRIAHRLVVENRRRCEAAIDRGGIDDRLERRSDLAVGLNGAVELAAAEIPAANHRLDLSGAVFNCNQRPFDHRRLIERRRGGQGGVVNLRHRDLDQVAGLKQVGR